jgi:hypothetical protein
MVCVETGTRHGTYALRDRGSAVLPEDHRASADAMLEQLLADLGGADAIPALKKELAHEARSLRLMSNLLAAHLESVGLVSRGKRVRSALDKWLSVHDRFVRVCAQLGLERTARQAPSLAE